MSDLEFQRELSPEQIREALSLLDSKTGAQNHNLRVEDQSPPEEVDLEVDQSSTITASQDRPPAAEDTQPRKKYLRFFADCAVKKWPLRVSLRRPAG